MNALVAQRYGAPEVVQWQSVPLPRCGPREVRVEVKATTVNSGDARLRASRFPAGMGVLGRLAMGWSKLRQPVLGAELAGVVREVGADVTAFVPGDRILAMTGMRMGAHAEQCIVTADHCTVRLPDPVSFEDAVTLPFGGTTALTFLVRKAKVQAGERVLVIGASGSVGTACVQVARRLAAHVTGVCSAANADLVRRLGADAVIDYQTQDLRALPDPYDVVVDTQGHLSLRDLRRLATPRGRIASIAAGLPQMLLAPWVALTSRQRLLTGSADESPADLTQLLLWLQSGMWEVVVDQRLPLSEGAKGHARVDSGRKRGALVLTA